MASYPRSTSDIATELGQLTPQHAFCTSLTLSKPTHGGRSVAALRIANGSKLRVMIVAGVHAREWAPPDAVLEFFVALLKAHKARTDVVDPGFVHPRAGGNVTFNPYTIPLATVDLIVNNLELYVAPMVNPDGRAFSLLSDKDWRKNLRPHPAGGASIGVDVNRNFDIAWDYAQYFDAAATLQIESAPIPSMSKQAKDETFIGPGPKAFTEPESENVRKFIADNDPHYYLDVHSHDGSINYPWGLEDNQILHPGDSFREKAWDRPPGSAIGGRDGPGVAHPLYAEWIPPALLASHKDLAAKVVAAISAAHGAAGVPAGGTVPAYRDQQSVGLSPITGASDDYAFSRQFPPATGNNRFAFTLEAGDLADGGFTPVPAQFPKVRRDIWGALVGFLTEVASRSLQPPIPIPQLPPKSPIKTLGTSIWGADWTHIVCYELPGGGPHATFYKSASGGASWDKIRPDGTGSDQITGESWETGWTSVVPFRMGGQPHLFTYKSGNGKLDIDLIRPDGSTSDTIKSHQWSTGWTSIFSFEMGGEPHFFSYKSGTGRVSIDRLAAATLTFSATFPGQFHTGWSIVSPFELGGQVFYLLYRGSDGKVAIDEIKPGGAGVDTRYADQWSTGWTALMPFTHGGRAYYLAYKSATGEVDIDRILPDLSGVENLYSGSMSPGITAFAPFTLNGWPHFISYQAAHPNEGAIHAIKVTSL